MSTDNSTNAAAGGGAMANRAPVTDRVNVEPAILRGMTISEAQIVASVSMVAFLLLGAILWRLTGFWQIVLILGIFGPSVCIWYASSYLAQVKLNRPDAYCTQAIHIWWAKLGVVSCKFTRHSGYWSLGRGLGMDLSGVFDVDATSTKPKGKPGLLGLPSFLRRRKDASADVDRDDIHSTSKGAA
jgi:conjugative transfer region protein (TIGR03750 family)